MNFGYRPVKFFFIAFVFLLNYQLSAQRFTISGKISDNETGEDLIGASVSINSGQTGTSSNEYGFYTISLPAGKVIVDFSYIGLSPRRCSLDLYADTVLNISLSSDAMTEEVIVIAGSNAEKVNSTQMGVEELSGKEIKEIPVVFGEADVLKVLQLKPGIKNGGEGTAGLFVRGGSPDQNLFILDEAAVYNPTHLFGIFSTFNADAISNVKLYKAGFPAEYGSKLSSVIDVRLREGNKKRFGLSGGIGIISSRLLVEGPLVKDKSSFLISGRRTYVDLITSLINKINEDNENWNPIPDYSFHDFNAKFNIQLSEKDRLYISAYYGRDFFTFKDDQIRFNFNWGNIASTIRWNRALTPKLFMNNSITISDYEYLIKNKFDEFGVELGSGISDVNLKSDYSWTPNTAHSVKYGIHATYHYFSVNRFDAGNGQDIQFEAGNNYNGGELAAYVADDWTINGRFSLNYGLRLSSFYNEKFFYGIEPRLSAKYSVQENFSIKGSYTRMYQYIHLVSSSGATLPTDVWYPSNPRVKPQSSDMLSLGGAYALGRDYFFSVEGYYKWLYGQVDFRDGAQLFVNDELDKEFVFGKGNTYGAEIYLEKKNGPIRGWIGYTLSWAMRQFPDIMDGSPFPSSSDRRHDISVVSTLDLDAIFPNARFFKKVPITLSLSWVYSTGKAYSLPEQRMIVTDITGNNPFNFVPVYSQRNAFRLPNYHRLDFGAVIKLISKKRFKSDMTLSVYNMYNRYNVFFIYIAPEYAPGTEDSPFAVPERFQAKAVTLLPIIPTLTWNFEF
jgi:hypothetical protein